MERDNPLEIQELLDQCIDLVSTSRQDLMACSLVARSWVNTTQSHLFRVAPSTPHFLSWRFFDTLVKFPHLIRHVHALTIRRPSDMDLINRIPFTHLESVGLVLTYETLEPWEDEQRFQLQQTLSLPHLRILSLFHRDRFSSFHRFFLHLSPTVQHLVLACSTWTAENLSALRERLPHVPLKSLRLLFWDMGDLESFDDQLFYPFSMLRLEALSIVESYRIPWNLIPKQTTESIRVLEISINVRNSPLDLSSFPNLSVIRLDGIKKAPAVCHTLSSLPFPRTIQTLVLGAQCTCIRTTCAALNQFLSTFECSTPLILEMEKFPHQSHSLEEDRKMFPIMMLEDRLRVVIRSADCSWWDETVLKPPRGIIGE
ncbi:hypothetical protein R3P38DRAFT_2664439 [Favolaschia claudopus]|uniref:F-box domain-containing protein n=1 Tax=Favolaschia claudopus TaxID=2862362 RepID=A0AAV9ZFI7_9AGAR